MTALLTPFSIVAKNKLRFSAFVVVNCILGAFGILCPLAVSGYTTSLSSGFWRILEAGNGYTFSVALLAAASYYLLGDAITQRETAFRGLRIGAALFGIVWLVWLSISASVHFSIEINTEAYPRSGFAITQIVSLLATITFAVWLFCVERLDDHENEELVSELKDRTKLLDRKTDARI